MAYVKEIVRHAELLICQNHLVRSKLDRKFADFLRRERGDDSYAKFAKKIGVSKTTLWAFENNSQSATLTTVDLIMRRLGKATDEWF